MPYPKTPRGIKSQITRLEENLKIEKNTFGAIQDGRGIRYEIGPLYMLLGDYEGALKAFDFFEKNFPDDCAEPLHTLMWALTLFKNKEFEKAESKLIDTMLINVYIIPKVVGVVVDRRISKHSFYFEEEEFCQGMPKELLKHWDAEAIEWAKSAWHSENVVNIREKYIELQNQIANARSGPRRTKLMRELGKLRKG
ncbi:MAG: tetratricopeptide repeat protein [Chloroflexota bacterium]